jgi:hypothetical protein
MSFPKGRYLDSIAYGRKTSYDSGLHRAIRRSTDNLSDNAIRPNSQYPQKGPMTLTRVPDFSVSPRRTRTDAAWLPRFPQHAGGDRNSDWRELQERGPEPTAENILGLLQEYGRAATVEVAAVFDLPVNTSENDAFCVGRREAGTTRGRWQWLFLGTSCRGSVVRSEEWWLHNLGAIRRYSSHRIC